MASGTTVTAYKAFGAGLVCRDFKYEVGATYEHKGRVELCNQGFHACLLPFDVFNYYRMFDDKGKPAPLAKVSVVDPSKVRAGQDSKIVTAKITIEATLNVSEWVREQCAALLRLVKGSNTAKATTGDYAHSATTGTTRTRPPPGTTRTRKSKAPTLSPPLLAIPRPRKARRARGLCWPTTTATAIWCA